MRYLAVLLLAACGAPPDFTGRFSGTIDETTTCSDGSGIAPTQLVTWVLSEHGSSVSIVPSAGTTCSTLTAATQPSGDAEIAAVTCPAYGDATTSFQDTIRSGGTLTLTDDKLAVKFTTYTTIFNRSTGVSGSCSSSTSGTLTQSK